MLLWASHLRPDFSYDCIKLHLSNSFLRVVRVWSVVSEAFSEDRGRKGREKQ